MSGLKRTNFISVQGGQRGFTLIELLIVLVILSILLLVAVPNYDSVINESKLDKARYNVASGLAFARTEAVKRGEDVSLCKDSDTGVSCGVASTTTSSWTGLGWKVVVDRTGESLRIDDADNSGVTVQYSCGDVVTYTAAGSRGSSLTTECQFTFADTKSVADSIYLCVAATGRVRMSGDACGS